MVGVEVKGLIKKVKPRQLPGLTVLKLIKLKSLFFVPFRCVMSAHSCLNHSCSAQIGDMCVYDACGVCAFFCLKNSGVRSAFVLGFLILAAQFVVVLMLVVPLVEVLVLTVLAVGRFVLRGTFFAIPAFCAKMLVYQNRLSRSCFLFFLAQG